MKISIRMDDITPDMDWEKFLRFKALCDSHHIKPLIGIVPHNRDKNLSIDAPRNDFWEYVRQLQSQGWTVAQHGFDHIYRTKKMGCFPLNRLSEFAGLGYDAQYERLKNGKLILESNNIKTDIFMAPAHSYDKNTLKALKALGFSKITDGFGNKPYNWHDMTFYPISYKQSSTLENADEGFSTFVVHSNTMNDNDFERYGKMFSEHGGRFISYSEYLKAAPERQSAAGHMAEYSKALAKYALVNIKGKL